jgi:hypothetical protein
MGCFQVCPISLIGWMVSERFCLEFLLGRVMGTAIVSKGISTTDAGEDGGRFSSH